MSNNLYRWVQDRKRLWKLREATVYPTELYAMLQALLYIEFTPHQSYLICSDSLGSLLALRNSFTGDPMVKTILARLNWLKSQNKIVSFCWIPSHQGIAGNEIADRSARMAASQGNFEDIPLRPDDIKSHLRNGTTVMWQREWDRTEYNTENSKTKHSKKYTS
ncbi:hypothetical protein JTB14_017065 [Gonioctena quinquepunctata]|nr:hypothetical protein JTB14_017065 [Gonioctena quinquepunctata]